MGREVRRVPPNWEHPKKDYPNHRLGRMEQDYQPMRDNDVESAWIEWQREFAKWIGGEGDRIREKYGDEDYPKDEPYRSFCGWHGEPPDPDYYRPRWDESTATWFQVYETVSEGTPVTPPFATKDELVEYLSTYGDFWDQKRGDGPWSRANAEQFVSRGHAMSLMVVRTAGSVDIKAPRDGS
jgi:hypothetical protein